MKNNEHAGNSMHAKVIILDNGHGVNTPGKRSPDGLFREYKWCRDFVKLLKYELEEWDYNVILLVPEEEDVSLSIRINRANKICAKYGAQNCILISIHNNAVGNGERWYNNVTGFEAFTSVGTTKSDLLTEFLYQEIEYENIKTRKDESDGDLDKEAYFSILTKTYCPAVLTENMFMDSKSDIEFLNSKIGINKLLKAHVCAIRRYFEDFNGTHESWLNYNWYWNKYWCNKNDE